MRSLFLKRREAPGRPAYGFFIAGALAVLAAVFVIGFQAGRYVEGSRAGGEGAPAAPGGADNVAEEIRRDLGAFAAEAEQVREVPPPSAVERTEGDIEAGAPGSVPGTTPFAPAAPRPATGAGEARADKGKPFSVQAGVFREEARAKSVQARLARAGFPASVRKTTRGS